MLLQKLLLRVKVHKIRNIYYLSPVSSVPCGGIHKIYQHVDALNKNGFNAFVLQQKANYRYPWRKNEVPVAHFTCDWRGSSVFDLLNWGYTNIRFRRDPDSLWKLLKEKSKLYALYPDDTTAKLPNLGENDVLVYPEYLVPDLECLIRRFPSVILNFTSYLTFKKLTMQKTLKGMKLPYDEKLLGCIVGSEDTANYLKFVYPTLPLYLCPFGVESEKFSYYPHKKKMIAFMPRKCPDHLVQIVNILKERNRFPGWSFASLENIFQEEMVEKMQASAIFLSTSYQEGFGLPPAEALACGSLVVGYDGEGGREFFIPPFAHAIPHGNIIAFIKKVEELMQLYEQDRDQFIRWGKEASDFIRNKYLMEQEDASVVQTWKKIERLRACLQRLLF